VAAPACGPPAVLADRRTASQLTLLFHFDMSHNTQLRQGATLTLVAALIISMVAAGGALAAPTTVTTASNSVPGEPTSTIEDGTTIDPFNGSSNVTETIVFNTSSNASAAGHVTIAANDTDQEVLDEDAVNVTPSDAAEVHDEQWRLNFTHADLMELERDAGENVTVDVMLLNDSDANYTYTSYTNLTVYIENDNATAVRYVGADDEDADVEEVEPFFATSALGLSEAYNTSTVEEDNVGIDGDTTDVYVVYGDSNVADSFESAREKSGFISFSAPEEGDFLLAHQATVAGTPTATYLDEPPEFLEDATTYGVATTVDGSEATRIELGEAYEDEDEIDVSTTGNEKWGLWTRTQGLQGYSFGQSYTQSIALMASPIAAGG